MEGLDEQTLTMLDNIMENQHRGIPENSPTILIEENTSRFSGAMWFEEIQKQKVIIAGIGGIGSWVTLLLSRLNVLKLYLYDMDRVEYVNMAGQFYSLDSIGQYKVDAVRQLVQSFSNYFGSNTYPCAYDADSSSARIMICGFDNMEAREIFFNKWRQRVLRSSDEERKGCLFIDGRLNAEEFQILAIQGNDEAAMSNYEENWLFDDSEVDEAVCSYKQTSFMSCMIASYMVNIFVNFIANLCNPIFPRDVPFFTSYSADTMFTKIEM